MASDSDAQRAPELDFVALKKNLLENNHDEVKRIVTRQNVAHRKTYQFWWYGSCIGVIGYLCKYGDDDPSLLYYFITLGASWAEEDSTYYYGLCYMASSCSKPKLLRALLDLNVRKMDHIGANRSCGRILIDAGLKPSYSELRLYDHAIFVVSRRFARSSAIAIIGIIKCRSRFMRRHKYMGRNVLQMIGRCIWEARGWDVWWCCSK